MNFEGILKERGLKITPQRITILQEIQSQGHITIEDLYVNIKKIYPSISLATIYKNIWAMCETNILNEIKVPLQKQLYEINHQQHIHLICQKCGTLQDLPINFDEIEQVFKKSQNFKILNYAITIYGVCKKCQK